MLDWEKSLFPNTVIPLPTVGASPDKCITAAVATSLLAFRLRCDKEAMPYSGLSAAPNEIWKPSDHLSTAPIMISGASFQTASASLNYLATRPCTTSCTNASFVTTIGERTNG